ncbi:SMI1/KNR4 family protein [Pseudomonas cichorii]|uniref:SMI1/KNR4 family protein n=1 Tax=Pseudomonas cichorii TaxID=36746 RepID=UPI001C8A83B2|nr:SMI1/KNR4 family protein [Pseudomonas cichorii]MBX8487757.1 SMI1/KNR4 family protein [Pseudomonas cichorii]MBX8497552.1 SMI1/KNR4 family protein [Pseudomonas cichorii]
MSAEDLNINGEWHRSPGATETALTALRAAVPQVLPDEYYLLLRLSNGGEGPLPVSPFNFVLDSVEVVLDLWQISYYAQAAPDMFVFGSNGGGELVAFDLRGNSPPWPIVCFDAIAPEESVQNIAENFTAFVSLIGEYG